MLLEHPAVQSFLDIFFDARLATSDLRVLKRLSALERKVGIDEDIPGEEEDEVTITERIQDIESRLDNQAYPETAEDFEPCLEVAPKTTLENKAYELVEYLKAKVKPRKNEIFMTPREFYNFMKNEISEDLRLKGTKISRQSKKDVFEKARELYPNNVFIVKKSFGHQETVIVWRP